jgi:hypothetical protein
MANNNMMLATLAVCALLVGGVFTYAFLAPVKVKETFKEGPIQYVDRPVINPINLTGVENKLDTIVNVVSKEDNFKQECLTLASEEWKAKDNKAIFEALKNIDYKEDITSVTVKDEDVHRMNIDSGNCKVTQELIVKYEDSDGDHTKVALEVKTDIIDNEVDSQEIEFM